MIQPQSAQAGLVHDLGNYIQIAASAVQIMSRHADVRASEGLGSIISHAADSLDRASALIRGSVTTEVEEQSEEVSLDSCLRQMGPLLSYACGPNVRLKLLVGLVPKVRCNSLALQNALLNLALNARDAMPGGGTLTITAIVADGPEIAEVDLTVRDTGIGMSPDILERAMEPHFSTKPAGGHGMGLPVVRAFVERFGGRISIESAPYAGTTVRLRLPAAR